MSSFLDLLSWKKSVRKIGGWERKRVLGTLVVQNGNIRRQDTSLEEHTEAIL